MLLWYSFSSRTTHRCTACSWPSKLVTGGGFVNQLVSSPVMIAVMIDSTTLILFRQCEPSHCFVSSGRRIKSYPGRILGLGGGWAGSAGFLGPGANDSVPVSSSGCSLYHCSHSASEYFFFFFFFFLGSHLSPQAPSHQYQSPPALRPLHSRPLGQDDWAGFDSPGSVFGFTGLSCPHINLILTR